MFLALLHSRKFWLAIFGVIQTVVFNIFPEFPEAMWIAIDGLVVVLIGTIAWEDSSEKRAGN